MVYESEQKSIVILFTCIEFQIRILRKLIAVTNREIFVLPQHYHGNCFAEVRGRKNMVFALAHFGS